MTKVFALVISNDAIQAFMTVSWHQIVGKYSSVQAYRNDTTVVYDSSLWRVRLCRKSTIPACYSLANVAIGSEDSYD